MAVPKLRFPEYKDGKEWMNTTIGQEGTFYYGKSAPKWSITEDAKTPCIRYGELYTKHDIIVKEISSYTNIDPQNLKFSKGNEVLVPRVGEDPLDFHKCAYLPFRNVAIGEMISVYNTDNNPLFMSYYFNATMKYKFARYVEGGNVSNLYYVYLKNIKIHMPDYMEQQKIADFLITFDKRINAQQNIIADLEETKKGLLQKIFSQEIRFKDDNGQDYPEWEEKRLGDISYVMRGLTYKPTDVRDDGIRVFRSSNISEDTFIYGEDDVFVDVNAVNIPFVQNGDILITAANGSSRLVGKHSVIHGVLNDTAVHGGFMLLIRSKDSAFINSSMYSSWYKKFVYKFVAGGNGAIGNLKKSDLENVHLFVPCEKEKNKIDDFLSIFDKKITAEKQVLSDLQEMKKGLLQQMFV